MYTLQHKKTVVKMGEWLGSMPWDTFSTITYRYDVKEKQTMRSGIRERADATFARP